MSLLTLIGQSLSAVARTKEWPTPSGRPLVAAQPLPADEFRAGIGVLLPLEVATLWFLAAVSIGQAMAAPEAISKAAAAASMTMRMSGLIRSVTRSIVTFR